MFYKFWYIVFFQVYVFYSGIHDMGFPDSSDSKESACNAGDLGSIPVRKVPWRREWLATPVLPREFHGQRSLVAYGPQGCKESDTTE